MTQQEFFARYTYKPSTDKLGGGAFGTVFKAYDETLGKYIAIKVAEQKHIGDRILSLADEFNALKNIQDHKNIAKYDVFYTFEQPTGVYDFALMQYYPDGNLSQLIKKGNLTTAQKENLALQLLNGISFLHQNNVVHRDLKPSNILIQKHELTQEYIPKITDFGLSKKANTDKNTHFTNSFAAGTYAYSSPEQLKGEILRFNTDLWAYGAIVYEIFTSKTMFNIQQKTGSSALDIKDILDNILNNDITHKIAELPIKWQQIVTTCLERNAQKRVKTADEILAILNSNKTNSEDETIIEPQEKTKPTESTIDKTQFETTRRVTTSTAAPSSMERIGANKKALYIGIAILAIGILTFAFWPKANNTNQTQTPIATSDSLPKTDTTTIATPAITETDWKKDFETKFAALQATEKQYTTEVNIKKYKELLASLPSEAKNEIILVKKKVDFFSDKEYDLKKLSKLQILNLMKGTWKTNTFNKTSIGIKDFVDVSKISILKEKEGYYSNQKNYILVAANSDPWGIFYEHILKYNEFAYGFPDDYYENDRYITFEVLMLSNSKLRLNIHVGWTDDYEAIRYTLLYDKVK